MDITERLPFSLSAVHAIASSYAAQGALPDFSIGGLPFRFAVYNGSPYKRQTFQFKRQQIDTSAEPGEQTLGSWWVRDQTTFHRGAGIRYYEPGSDKSTLYRYESSVGVDVWTPGQAQLHKAMDSLVSTTSGNPAYATSGVVSGADVIFIMVGSTVSRHDGTTKTDYSASTTPATPVAVAGATILAGSTTQIMSGPASGSALTALWTNASGLVVPYWAKSRIIATQGADIFDLTLAGGDLSLETPLWTHPDSSWTWAAVAEAPDAILAAGRSTGQGAIYSFTLTDSGSSSTPTLGAAIQVASLPPGEEIYSMATYVGTYIAVGTSKGIRIGTVGAGGEIQLGPLTVETTYPVYAITARDTYFFAAVQEDLDGNSGAVRIDVSTEIPRPTNADVSLTYVPTLRYAYAYDGNAQVTGVVHGIAFLGTGDRLVLGVKGSGIYLQSATDYETSGHLTIGRVRYATAEPKSFRYVKVRASTGDDSTVGISSIDSNGSTTSVFTLGGSFSTNEDISLGLLAETEQEYAAIKLTLNASTDTLTTPVVEDLQLKATPQPKLQRQIEVPLRLIDIEEDRNGNRIGFEGAAFQRLEALEALEQASAVVSVVDHTTGEGVMAQIANVAFVRTAPPARNAPNFGGVVTVTLITV